MGIKELFIKGQDEDQRIDLIEGMDFDEFVADVLRKQEEVDVPVVTNFFTEVLEEARQSVVFDCQREMKNFIDIYGKGNKVDIARNIDILVRRLHIICFQGYRTARKEYMAEVYNQMSPPYDKLRETFLGPRIETRRLLAEYKTEFGQFQNLVAHLYEGNTEDLLADRERFFDDAINKLREIKSLPQNLQEVRM